MSKEQERAELHRVIWKIANDLSGSVDGWDFKSYVLGMLFYRYISERIATDIDTGEHRAGNMSFRYAALSDAEAESEKEDIVNTYGFFIAPSELFVNVQHRAANDARLNETLAAVFKHIESSAIGTES